MGMITGLGQVSILLGQIQRYRVGFGSATWFSHPQSTGPGRRRLDRAGRARSGRLGRAEFGPKLIFN
jgi:hypothetical protein